MTGGPLGVFCVGSEVVVVVVVMVMVYRVYPHYIPCLIGLQSSPQAYSSCCAVGLESYPREL